MLSAIVLAHEIKVDRIAGAARLAIVGMPITSQGRVRGLLAGCESAHDERVVISCLAGIAGMARVSSGAAITSAELARGRQAAAHFGADLPVSGEALTAIALFESNAKNMGSQERAITALMASYRSAPFLRKIGLWRLWYASHHWDLLTPQTRRAVFAEAIWYGTLGKSDRDAVLSALLDTPAFVRVAIRLPGGPGEALPLPQKPE